MSNLHDIGDVLQICETGISFYLAFFQEIMVTILSLRKLKLQKKNRLRLDLKSLESLFILVPLLV